MIVALVALLAGCTSGRDSNYVYEGYPMDDFFSFDGNRSWTYTNDDTTIPFHLEATLVAGGTEVDLNGSAVNQYRVDYTTTCFTGTDDGTCTDGPWRIRYALWSSDQTFGTLLWGYEDDTGVVTFDPPVEITSENMKVGDVSTTETGGATWTSEFVSIGDCPVKWTEDWDDCVNLRISDGGAGFAYTGDIWVITSYNIVALQLKDDAQKWQLLSATYTGN